MKMLRYIVTFLILIISFSLFMYIGCLIPSKYLEKNVKESSVILNKQTNTYQVFDDVVLLSLINGCIDNFTDILMINESYSVDSTNPLYSAFAVRRSYKKNVTKVEEKDTRFEAKSYESDIYYPHLELSNLISNKVHTSVNYARYWHGYLPILRFLLLFFNISQIRILLFILFLALIIALFVKIIKVYNLKIAFIFLISLISVGYFFVSFSLQESPIFILTMIASLFLLGRIKKFDNSKFYYFIFIVGCFANFVDYLTVPLISLCVPLYLYMIYTHENSNVFMKDKIKFILVASILWLVGYSFTWLFKWILFDVLFSENLILLSLNQVFYRVGGSPKFMYKSKSDIFFLLGIWGFISILIGSITFLVFKFIKRKNIKVKYSKFSLYIKNNLDFILLSIYPFIWYIVLLNHTVSHWHFVCRNFLIFYIGFIFLLLDFYEYSKSSKLRCINR